MATLAVSSQKGGVGKTTVSLNLAYAMALRGWKTLLLDTDPQGAVGNSLQGAQSHGAGVIGYLEGGKALSDAVIKTRVPDLDILAIGGTTSRAAHEAYELMSEGSALADLIRKADEKYALVIVDTPSGMYGVTRSVLETVEYLLVPLQSEPLALRTIAQVLDTIGEVREEGHSLALAGFVITMLNSRDDVSLSVAQESWSTLPTDLVLETSVPRDASFLSASAHGVPLPLLSRRPPPVASVFDQIAAELEPKLLLISPEADDGPISLLD